MYLVGIDVGTTNTKAVIFDAETGRVCAVGSSRTMTHHPRVEWSEFDADDLWSTVVESLRQAIAQCEHPERIRAISVASMGEAGFPLDESRQVLYPAIAWYDPRTEAQAQWWRDTVGSERVYDITGHVLHAMFGINKLLWLRDNEPTIFVRIRHWLSIEDFVLWKLSGEIATDYSIASRTMVFNQHALTWSETLLSHANIPVEWFAPAFPSGTMIGTLRREVAEETGLPQQISVVTGGHDHLCGALATGVTRPGQFLDSTGTTSVILALSNTFQPDATADELRAAGYTTYAYVVRDTYATLGSMSFAGGALEWLVTLLYGQGASVDDEIYAQAVREGAQIPLGSRGAIVLPYLLGAGTPYGRKSAYGTIFGLTPSHGRAELVRALMEGLAFWLRDNLEALRRLGIAPAHPEIIAIGGPTRATLLMQIKADITGCRIRVPQIEEAGAAGAALLAGMGIGAFHSSEEATAALHHDETTYTPQQEAQVVYDDIYHQAYLPACRTVLSLQSA
jgi:xylulokinase